MRIAFCVFGVSDSVVRRTEFYRQDLDILRSLGHEVDFVSSPWRLHPRFDLAVVWWWNYLWCWGPVARVFGIPIIVTGVYDVTIEPTMPSWKRALKRFGCRFGALNVVVSRYELEPMGAIGQFRRSSLRYSPIAVDTNVYSPQPAEERTSEFVLLNVALQEENNVRRKMIGELLEAFARIHRDHPDSRLILAGPPSTGGAGLRARAKELGVEDVVEFPGEITADEKISLMRRCTLYCQISRFEGFGLATAEAMACGKPVLVSAVGAVPEVVGDAGFYVDELSVGGIERSLRQLVNDLPRTEGIGVKARERIIREFSVARRRRDFESFISEVKPLT